MLRAISHALSTRQSPSYFSRIRATRHPSYLNTVLHQFNRYYAGQSYCISPDTIDTETRFDCHSQETVDTADEFPAVWKRFRDFLDTHGLLEPEALDSSVFLTCGDWDLKTMLPNQLKLVDAEYGLDDTGCLISPYNRWINVKKPFRKHLGLPNHNIAMTGMLSKLKLDLVGRHHSGIDDCKNILHIVQKMREGGWDPSTAVRTA